ncbi:hypothetical protein [Kitasatospora sp. NPDC001527]|uniref:hypothetical protein n=1 Tax=Kitasatospora sp. NPDC001527 TaxID=3154519 RepID=UPI00331E5FFA
MDPLDPEDPFDPLDPPPDLASTTTSPSATVVRNAAFTTVEVAVGADDGDTDTDGGTDTDTDGDAVTEGEEAGGQAALPPPSSS